MTPHTDQDRIGTILSEFKNFPDKNKELFSFFEKEFKKKIRKSQIHLSTTNNLISYVRVYKSVNNETPDQLIDCFLNKKVLEIRATTLDILIEDYHEDIPDFKLRQPDIWMIEIIDSILKIFYTESQLASFKNHDSKDSMKLETLESRNTQPTSPSIYEHNVNHHKAQPVSDKGSDKENDSAGNGNIYKTENLREYLLQLLVDLFLKDSLALFLSQQKFKRPGNQLVLNYIYFIDIFSNYVNTEQYTIDMLYDNIERAHRMDMYNIRKFLESHKNHLRI